MDRFDHIFGGMCAEFQKLAAESSKKKTDAATAMPPTPLESENELLSQQLENLSLKMQLRQAMMAQQAVSAQDQQAAEEEAAQQQQQAQQAEMDQNQQMMGMMNPAMAASKPPALAQNPQDMIGAK